INSFPDSYRIPFNMHVAGYKYSEIAQRLKLPVGTVKSRIYYARKYLQKALSDYND
ncbi:MAG: RNA polymerase sigma factor, partial [Paramuribaculum sp.]|nr:RNA polymerase sigma factor [Paramuribaculum sp.]